jgi:hypothetical protein
MKRTLLIALMVAIIIAGCAASPEKVQTAIAGTQSQWTSVPTIDETEVFQKAETHVWAAVEETVIAFGKEVDRRTATARAALPTNTPAPTNTPVQTVDLLLTDKRDGFYLVGVKIAPGVWKSTGTGDDCYWAIYERDDDIINNHFGLSGGTMYIPTDAFQVRMEDCGTWEYLGPP